MRGLSGSVIARDRLDLAKIRVGLRRGRASPADRLLRDIKYEGSRGLARAAGRWLVEGMTAHERALPALLLPVPLHFRRRLYRGYNQSGLLADGIAESWTEAKRADGLLRRVRHDASLTSATRVERQMALVDRYVVPEAMIRRLPPSDCPPIYLVDDVLTTGATARACTIALEKAGYRLAGAFFFVLA